MIMGYDRYVAICHPLRYNVLMSPRDCTRLVSWCWAGGSVMGMILTLIVFHLTFCGSNEIHHYGCHVFALLKLACGEETATDGHLGQPSLWALGHWVTGGHAG